MPLQTQAFLAASPMSVGADIGYLAFTATGYHVETSRGNAVWRDPSSNDALSIAGDSEHIWVEQALSPYSRIVELRDLSRVVINNARDPILSADRRSVAFVRDDHGRGELMVRKDFHSVTVSESALTPPSLNVYEASFLSEKDFAFSATEGRHSPQIYLRDAGLRNMPLGLGESRYPALSPDGHWLAYSHRSENRGNAACCRSAMQLDSAVMGKRLQDSTLCNGLRAQPIVDGPGTQACHPLTAPVACGEQGRCANAVVPRACFERNWECDLAITAGTFYQSDDQLSCGRLPWQFAFYASTRC
jgi:hypothetical protein